MVSFEATKSDLGVDHDQEWVQSVFWLSTSIVAHKGGKDCLVVLAAFPESTIETYNVHLAEQ